MAIGSAPILLVKVGEPAENHESEASDASDCVLAGCWIDSPLRGGDVAPRHYGSPTTVLRRNLDHHTSVLDLEPATPHLLHGL